MNMPTQLCPGEGYPELNYRGLARWRDAGWNQRIGGCVNPQNPEPSGLLARDKPTSGYVAINYRILQSYQEQATTTILCWPPLRVASLLHCLLPLPLTYIGIAVWPLSPAGHLASLVRVCQPTCCNFRTYHHQVRIDKRMGLCLSLPSCLLNCLLPHHLLYCLSGLTTLLCPVHTTPATDL